MIHISSNKCVGCENLTIVGLLILIQANMSEILEKKTAGEHRGMVLKAL